MTGNNNYDIIFFTIGEVCVKIKNREKERTKTEVFYEQIKRT